MDKELIPLNNDLEQDNTLNNAISYFKDEENELNKAIKEIDDLYNEIKTHYDGIKSASRSANGGKGVLSFIHLQTSNLVSLKNSKAQLINSKINMKKIEAELALKHKKDQTESEINADIVNAVIKKLEANSEENLFIDEEPASDKKSVENADFLLEERIRQLQKSGDIELDEENSDEEKEGILAILVKDKKWKFIGIDENNKIIKGFPVPNKKEFTIKLHKDKKGRYTATDQNDRIYKVIKK